MKKLFNLKMTEGVSVTKHLNEFNTIINQLSSVEIDFDDEIQALIVLASLPNSWDAMRTAVSNSAGKNKLRYDDIRDLILGEEVRRRDSGEASSSSGSALNTEGRSRGFERNANRGRSKSRRGRSKSRSGKQPECWDCGKVGHYRRNCKESKSKNNNESVNAATENVQDALLLSADSPMDTWILDSGASFHTTADREIIDNYVAGDFGKVYLADGEPLDIVGMGEVRINLPTKSTWVLQKVRHVPKLMRNLIFVEQLDVEGHVVTFGNDSWKISRGAMVIARGSKTGTLYMTMHDKSMIGVVDSGENTEL